MKLSEKIRVSPDVVTREVGEETMLLNLASGTYYGLNEVGARFMSLIGTGKSPFQARDALLELFDVTPAVLERDLEALLYSLSLNGIIVGGS